MPGGQGRSAADDEGVSHAAVLAPWPVRRGELTGAGLGGTDDYCWSTRMFDLHAVGQMLSQVRSWLWAKLAPVADGVVVGVALA
jgi:hypothetical protein